MNARRMLWAAALIGGIASPLLTHWALTVGLPLAVVVSLIVLQMVAAYWFVFTHVPGRYYMTALGALGLCSAALLFMRLEGGLALSAALTHTLMYVLLLTLFGTSLLPRREPLVTRFARQIHGPLADGVRHYTRVVTRAWCVFFALQLLVSALLFTWAPLPWWSLFVNVLNLPLVCMMFLAERLSRPLWVADPPREEFARLMELVQMLKKQVALRDTGIS